MAASLQYHEPDIVQILVLTSFLLFLNISNYIVDKYLSCGLVAQIVIGILWGTPIGKFLSIESENTITSLGYIGLILLVFEGGLSTSVTSLRKNLFLSSLVAITGIVLPIGLSFVLLTISNASPLQSFAAGAALCSTSLGTTFTVLRASGFAKTRLGSILTSAAMLDDVVGLVMVQVISNLRAAFQIASVLRPVGVSVGFALFSVCICLVAKHLSKFLLTSKLGIWLVSCRHSSFMVQTSFLLAMITTASYAGTSNLLAAYLAGVCLRWWYSGSREVKENDPKVPAPKPTPSHGQSPTESPAQVDLPQGDSEDQNGLEAEFMFQRYYLPCLERLLKPFFFASIGFAIPITQMFEGDVIWRGLIYALLMCIAKLFTGVWLIQFDIGVSGRCKRIWVLGTHLNQKLRDRKGKSNQKSINLTCTIRNNGASTTQCLEQKNLEQHQQGSSQLKHEPEEESVSTPTSLYPAAILGMAMISRGEIGFLIAASAESSGIYEQNGSRRLYLVVTWAIVLCTIVGPVATGILVKRVKRLQREERSSSSTERTDPLGSWGVT